jgi:hypothetical protein
LHDINRDVTLPNAHIFPVFGPLMDLRGLLLLESGVRIMVAFNKPGTVGLVMFLSAEQHTFPSLLFAPDATKGIVLILPMRAFRQFGVVVLLLVSCLAPAMACMVPDAKMNTEERACCRMMKNQCGQMEMPASHGCCQKTPASVHDNALDTKAVVFHPAVVPVIWLAAFELVNPTTAAVGWVERPDYSPPKPLPATISILRI